MIWVIGGGRVYREAMELAQLLVVTEIDLEVEGDTTGPEIPEDFSLDAVSPSTAGTTPPAERATGSSTTDAESMG
ncbi:dihydrofolate reductase [Brachybacterium sp. Z12]|uniref:dihydrofolate reductase n=1 Tax=Brachybacterium sp. Z12 TaxID=2759167 RepID=UPI00185F7F89|nr:dihydrofolate reductase [Brachybacterium sp. Z12]QNN82347.1 dihydrofolate reductase [Brachybacterium sp. Z12]